MNIQLLYDCLWYLGIGYCVITVVLWYLFSMVLFVDQEIGITVFRKRCRTRLFKDVCLWCFTNPIHWLGFYLAITFYPWWYLFRMQRVGCVARQPQKPSPWLANEQPPVKEESCSTAVLELGMANGGAYAHFPLPPYGSN